MVQYYATCIRELWYFANGINQNYEDENILIGKWLQQRSFSKEKKDVLIDNTISIDFIRRGESIIVHEIKKSSRLPYAVKAQVLYYLWYLKKKKGVETKGMIVYPKEKKKEEVILNKQDEEYIEQLLEEIPIIIATEKPPQAVEKSFCKNCSYYEFCRC